ncbi:MAG: (2Fe-2S)-binding protein [Alphaproteobacteria bacterium]|nr:(2Fe-2S)-binding protein [Alphaproteobacteria bacterium]
MTAGAIRTAARAGAQGPNQAKSFLRTGMGACQGRMCGPVVSEIMAAAHGISVEQAGYYRIRPPLKPITVGELAEAEID